MSGIVAVFDRSGEGEVAPAAVEPMLARIDHRGPDGSDAWIDDAIGLGHQQLQSTPQAVYDDQPYSDGDLTVVADLRLDNRPELFDALSVSGDPARVPDSHLLLAAYREWGEACVEHLIGAYAFVVWDAQRERAFCGRDHFGVKPLYYYRSEDAFAVASEVKALLELPAVAPRLDETKIGDFLTEQFDDKENTIYEPIRRLPPAHACTVTSEETEQWEYWSLDPTRTITLESDEAYARRFRELFEQAVSCRLRTDDDVGTTLSGGLDSSSVTTIARQELPDDRPLRTFSGIFEETPACDEREFIEPIVQREGIEPHYVNVDSLSPVGHFEAAFEYQDEPIHNTVDYMNWALAERGAEEGVGVVLEGTHGDSAVDYGLGLLPELARRGRWLHLWRELRAMGRIVGRSPRDLLVSRVVSPLLPPSALRTARRLRGVPVDGERTNPALDPEFVERIGFEERLRTFGSSGSVLKRSASRWQYRSLMTGNITAYLEVNDHTHAAFGIEPRYPFTDPRLVEFSLAIPATQKLSDGWTRLILRRALDGVLPPKVQWRPWKTTLNASFDKSLAAEDEQLRRYVLDSDSIAPYLDASELAASYERFTEAPGDPDSSVLWRALSLSRWIEATADQRTSEERASATERPAVTDGERS